MRIKNYLFYRPNPKTKANLKKVGLTLSANKKNKLFQSSNWRCGAHQPWKLHVADTTQAVDNQSSGHLNSDLYETPRSPEEKEPSFPHSEGKYRLSVKGFVLGSSLSSAIPDMWEFRRSHREVTQMS